MKTFKIWYWLGSIVTYRLIKGYNEQAAINKFKVESGACIMRVEAEPE